MTNILPWYGGCDEIAAHRDEKLLLLLGSYAFVVVADAFVPHFGPRRLPSMWPCYLGDCQATAPLSFELMRFLVVLLQLFASFLLGTAVIALASHGSDAHDTWLSTEYKLLSGSWKFLVQEMRGLCGRRESGNSEALGIALSMPPAKSLPAPNLATVAVVAMAAKPRSDEFATQTMAGAPTEEPPQAMAGTPVERRRDATLTRQPSAARRLLSNMTSKTFANLNLGNLGNLQVMLALRRVAWGWAHLSPLVPRPSLQEKRRQQVLQLVFERHFGLEVCVAIAIATAHWMHGNGLMDPLFIVWWILATLTLIASRGDRLLLYAESQQLLASVEQATLQAEGELPASLLDGTICLVDISWLIEHARAIPAGEGIGCHQTLPLDAFLTPSASHALLDTGGGGSIAALSYGSKP